MCKHVFLNFALAAGVPARRRAPCLVGLRGNSTAGNDWSADEEPRVADIEEKLTIGNTGSLIADIEEELTIGSDGSLIADIEKDKRVTRT